MNAHANATATQSQDPTRPPLPTTYRHKRESLRTSGALNPHPEHVTSPLFRGFDFFDPCDLVQVRYEMLRLACVDGASIKTAAAAFGFSRVAWYQTKARYDAHGLMGLLPRPRGPQPHPQKQTPRPTSASAKSMPIPMPCVSNMNSSDNKR